MRWQEFRTRYRLELNKNRSANTYLVLRMLGYPQVRNYLGSWSEWGNRDDSTIVIPGED